MPKLTFGIPVYNSVRLMRRAIDSVLAQTFHDFELVISDNCSTDATGDIGNVIAARKQLREENMPKSMGGSGVFVPGQNGTGGTIINPITQTRMAVNPDGSRIVSASDDPATWVIISAPSGWSVLSIRA